MFLSETVFLLTRPATRQDRASYQVFTQVSLLLWVWDSLLLEMEMANSFFLFILWSSYHIKFRSCKMGLSKNCSLQRSHRLKVQLDWGLFNRDCLGRGVVTQWLNFFLNKQTVVFGPILSVRENKSFQYTSGIDFFPMLLSANPSRESVGRRSLRWWRQNGWFLQDCDLKTWYR